MRLLPLQSWLERALPDVLCVLVPPRVKKSRQITVKLLKYASCSPQFAAVRLKKSNAAASNSSHGSGTWPK
jgi:hypothetical protein